GSMTHLARNSPPANLAYNGVSLCAAAGPVSTIVRELRCMCLTTTPGIHPRMITKMQVVAAGPQCSKVEVVATLKNKKEVCLDPETPVMKKIIQKMLDRYPVALICVLFNLF
uniref:C-X-C motif chemokine n=1 Tax=Ursus maritimus TaxID=29073 RepID=A0A452TKN2_URSMA